MVRKKSEARHFSARFNPITDENERRVIEIIDDYVKRGYNFKNLALNAILEYEGVPVVSPHTMNSMQLLKQMQSMLVEFAQEILEQINSGERSTAQYDDASDEDEGAPSRFAQQFAAGFMERQRRVMGDED